MIGDVEPEDVYDASDPLPVRLAVAGRIVAGYLAERGYAPARAERRRRDLIRVLEDLLDDIRDDAT